jgi:hypothetical protein
MGGNGMGQATLSPKLLKASPSAEKNSPAMLALCKKGTYVEHINFII